MRVNLFWCLDKFADFVFSMVGDLVSRDGVQGLFKATVALGGALIIGTAPGLSGAIDKEIALTGDANLFQARFVRPVIFTEGGCSALGDAKTAGGIPVDPKTLAECRTLAFRYESLHKTEHFLSAGTGLITYLFWICMALMMMAFVCHHALASIGHVDEAGKVLWKKPSVPRARVRVSADRRLR